LASKMLFNNSRLAQLAERWMEGLLINKNLRLYMRSKVEALFLVKLRNPLHRKAKPKYNPSASDILLKRISRIK